MEPVILLVEDDFHVRELVRRYLATQDCEVLEASNREEAVRLMEGSRRIDILLTDIVLSGTADGFAQVCQTQKVLPITGKQSATATCAKEIAKELLLAEPFRQLELLNGISKRLGHWAVNRNPILGRAHEYWLRKSAGGRAPDRSELDPREITGILPYLSIVEIVERERERRHRYRLVGTRVVEALGCDPTNAVVEESGTGDAEFLHKLCMDVARAGHPTYAASPLGSEEEGRSTERLFLPFRLGGTSIRQIVIAQTFEWRRRETSVHDLAREHAEQRDTLERPPDDTHDPRAQPAAVPVAAALASVPAGGWQLHQPQR